MLRLRPISFSWRCLSHNITAKPLESSRFCRLIVNNVCTQRYDSGHFSQSKTQSSHISAMFAALSVAPASQTVNHIAEPDAFAKAPLIDPRSLKIVQEFNLPNSRARSITLPSLKNEAVVDPATKPAENIIKTQPHLIVIRHKKMKKHKLRKLRKRMMFVFRRRALAKRKAKEKAMQDFEKQCLKKAELFDPEKFVTERIQAAREGGWHVDPVVSWQKRS